MTTFTVEHDPRFWDTYRAYPDGAEIPVIDGVQPIPPGDPVPVACCVSEGPHWTLLSDGTMVRRGWVIAGHLPGSNTQHPWPESVTRYTCRANDPSPRCELIMVAPKRWREFLDAEIARENLHANMEREARLGSERLIEYSTLGVEVKRFTAPGWDHPLYLAIVGEGHVGADGEYYERRHLADSEEDARAWLARTAPLVR